jgi:hypothetical protein
MFRYKFLPVAELARVPVAGASAGNIGMFRHKFLPVAELARVPVAGASAGTLACSATSFFTRH